MKSVEIKFHEALETLKEAGQLETFNQQSIALVGVEPKLNLALELLEKTQYGAERFKERQYKAYRASGMSEAEARAMAGLPESQIIKEAGAGRSARETADDRKVKGLKERQYSAYRATGMSEAEARVAAGL